MKREMKSNQIFPSSAFSLMPALCTPFDAWLLILLMSCRWLPEELCGPLSFLCCIVCQQQSFKTFPGADLWEQNMTGTFHIFI